MVCCGLGEFQLIEGDKPEDIYEETTFFPVIGVKYNHIGRFTQQDGSGIEVYPKYAEGAERFSELYRDEFSMDVSVICSKKIDQKGINC